MENEPIDTGIQIEYKCQVTAYSELFCFFFEQYGLTLLNSEMDDIIHQCDKFKQTFNCEKTNLII